MRHLSQSRLCFIAAFPEKLVKSTSRLTSVASQFFLAAIAAWTVLVIASLTYNLNRVAKDVLATAEVTARANINKDISFRKWATG